jgi:periplasmic protein TonB
MNKGKITCDVLKEIRKQIASENKIHYQTHECTFEGECRGTCPACESEVQYLENEIVKRKYLGKAVVIAGLSVGLLGTFTDCSPKNRTIKPDNQNNPKNEVSNGKDFVSDTSLNTTPHGTFHPKCNAYNNDFTLGSMEGELDSTIINTNLEILTDTIQEINEVIETDGEIEPPIGFIEIMPEFPGGPETFMEYLNKELHYPENCRKDSVTGVVLVDFVIEKDGKVSNVKAQYQVHPDLDAEAIRVIQNSPKWIPGTQMGKPIRVTYSIPIRFTLSNN